MLIGVLLKKTLIVKIVIQIVLWIVALFMGYLIYASIEAPIQFEKVKKERYMPVIEKLTDIRRSQIAYKDVTGHYADNFDSLVRFIDTAEFVITQRRDTSFLDEEFKKTYGVDKYINDVIVDTLGYSSVKDSLFKNSDRYKQIMYVPNTNDEVQFEIQADSIRKNDSYIQVFEVRVDKALLLEDQDKNLVERERKRQSVDDVNGPYIQVGSMSKVNDDGNWPKDYGKKSQ